MTMEQIKRCGSGRRRSRWICGGSDRSTGRSSGPAGGKKRLSGWSAGKRTSVLAFWDIKGRQVVGGIAQEFVDRLEQAGASYGHEYCPHHQSVTLIHPFYSRILCFEMVKEAGVELLMHCELADVK